MNLYKTGTVAKTALNLFSEFVNVTPDKIKDFEVDILESTYKGALYHGEPYTGKAYKYDIISAYSSIMKSTHMQFPIKEGVSKTLTRDEFDEMAFFKYGCYKTIIHILNPKLLRQSIDNWNTHIDLNRAKELKYKIELIEEENNFLSYEGKLINGRKLFGGYIDYLYKFKQDGHSCVKKYLNNLAGKLGQLNTIKLTSKDIIRADSKIVYINRASDNLEDGEFPEIEIHKVADASYYIYDFARILPFLVAKGRYITSKFIEKQVDAVKYMHTDGWIMSERIDAELGSDIGDLKYEGKCKKVVIKNCTKPKEKFKL